MLVVLAARAVRAVVLQHVALVARRWLRQMAMHRVLERAFARVQRDRFLHVEGLLDFGLLFPHLFQERCVKGDCAQGIGTGVLFNKLHLC